MPIQVGDARTTPKIGSTTVTTVFACSKEGTCAEQQSLDYHYRTRRLSTALLVLILAVSSVQE